MCLGFCRAHGPSPLRSLVPLLLALLLAPAAHAALKGDLNGDGKIGIVDAVTALRIVAGLSSGTPEALALGDVSPAPMGDGKLNIMDAVLLLRCIAGLVSPSDLQPPTDSRETQLDALCIALEAGRLDEAGPLVEPSLWQDLSLSLTAPLPHAGTLARLLRARQRTGATSTQTAYSAELEGRSYSLRTAEQGGRWLLASVRGAPVPGSQSIRVGVLMPLTGPDSLNVGSVLDWEAGELNKRGGVNGRRLELVYKDLNGARASDLAHELLTDSSIRAVIGPQRSADLASLGPLFVGSRKLLISPTATAGDLFRMFGGMGYVWRTLQGDVAQIRTILYLLSLRGVRTLSLIYEDGAYGKTFYDWLGFFALELGIEVQDLVPLKAGTTDVSEVVRQAIAGKPDEVVCVTYGEDMVRVRQEMLKQGSTAGLFLSDAGESPYVVQALGQSGEGVEVTCPGPDPGSGFEPAFRNALGQAPLSYSAPIYDSLLLCAAALARADYADTAFPFPLGESLSDSLRKAVSGTGATLGCLPDDLSQAINQLAGGQRPVLKGASGPLSFDREFGVDPTETFFAHRVIRNGKLKVEQVLSTNRSLGVGVDLEGASAYRTRASEKLAALAPPGSTGYTPPARSGLWALICATSSGWENYRHQADALAFYDLLRNNGVRDDRIILMIYDDLPGSASNKRAGAVIHEPGGPDLRASAEVDYTGNQVSLANFRSALLGDKASTPGPVLESDATTDVLLYLVDHGGRNGSVPFVGGGTLKPADLGAIISEMSAKKRYRQMLVAVEVCFSEMMASAMSSPGVLFIGGAAKTEPSFAASYDGGLGVWLSDEFTNTLLTVAEEDWNQSISDFYANVYSRVTGSHVRLLNAANFGDVTLTPIGQFLAP
ncbi:MAG TPA: C13 family peptidase [Armatimonadota bacterium]